MNLPAGWISTGVGAEDKHFLGLTSQKLGKHSSSFSGRTTYPHFLSSTLLRAVYWVGSIILLRNSCSRQEMWMRYSVQQLSML